MNYLELFQMPTIIKITARSSTITNAFINSIIPVVYPTEKEVKKALKILEISPSKFECIYCGSKATEWDHLRPLIKNKKPTGYISELYNLVPSCGKCNQSKGNRYWKEWISSRAKNSPLSKGVADISDRIRRLEAYEKWMEPTKINFEEAILKNAWERHWNNCHKIHCVMIKSQLLADKIQLTIKKKYIP